MKRMKFILIFLITIVVSVACGSPVYLEGELENTYLVGEIKDTPGKPELRRIGEEMSKKILTFNYLESVPEKINILNTDTSEYNILKGSDVGGAEVLTTKDVKAGMSYIHYATDLSGIFDNVKRKWNSWFMPDYPPFSPPTPTQEDIKNFREFSEEVAEKIATEFLAYMGIPVDGFQVRVTISETKIFADVLFIEKLADEKIDSPNWVKVKVNFWGMVKEFVSNKGPTPVISTKPIINQKEVKEIARGKLNISDKIRLPNPVRVIKRTRFEKNGEVFVKDELGWFFDLIKVENIRENTLLISAHDGELLK